jgi:hypothetical protein
MFEKRRQRNALLDEIRQVARHDLDDVAEELAKRAAEPGDRYEDAVLFHQGGDGLLAIAKTLEHVREVGLNAGRARRLVRGQPANAEPCFFDPRHGAAVRQAMFAPEGGALRPVPACEACAEEMDAGRLPAFRTVVVDGHPEPYWRSAAHVGYAGRGKTPTLDDLIEADDRPGVGVAGAEVGLGLLELLMDSWWTA